MRRRGRHAPRSPSLHDNGVFGLNAVLTVRYLATAPAPPAPVFGVMLRNDVRARCALPNGDKNQNRALLPSVEGKRKEGSWWKLEDELNLHFLKKEKRNLFSLLLVLFVRNYLFLILI